MVPLFCGCHELREAGAAVTAALLFVSLQEARAMVKARKAGVSTPCLYLIDSSNSKMYMERIDGVTAKHFILDCMESESPPLLATPVVCSIRCWFSLLCNTSGFAVCKRRLRHVSGLNACDSRVTPKWDSPSVVIVREYLLLGVCGHPLPYVRMYTASIPPALGHRCCRCVKYLRPFAVIQEAPWGTRSNPRWLCR